MSQESNLTTTTTFLLLKNTGTSGDVGMKTLKQNVKYDSQTGKVYEELGSCGRGAGATTVAGDSSTNQVFFKRKCSNEL